MTATGVTATEATAAEISARLRAVPRPQRMLSRAREEALTPRQHELLDGLEVLFDAGFADLTMAMVARRLNCSLRTLYALAPSRDDLMLIVVDRYLWRIGRIARDAMITRTTVLDTLKEYLRAVSLALVFTSDAFARDLETVPTVSVLIERHNDYAFAITRALLVMAVEKGEMAPTDTAALARVMAGLGWAFTRPEVRPLLETSPKAAADAVVDIIVRGLQASADAA